MKALPPSPGPPSQPGPSLVGGGAPGPAALRVPRRGRRGRAAQVAGGAPEERGCGAAAAGGEALTPTLTQGLGERGRLGLRRGIRAATETTSPEPRAAPRPPCHSPRGRRAGPGPRSDQRMEGHPRPRWGLCALPDPSQLCRVPRPP